MIYARIEFEGRPRGGLVEGGKIRLLDGDIFGGFTLSERLLPLEGQRLLAPCDPTKIVAVGLNYRDHIREMGHDMPSDPTLFIKPSTAVIGPGDDIVLPPSSQRVDYEAELAVVIKKAAKNITPEQAREYILGYTCLNDVTARDLQKQDGQWSRAKGFDTFAPVGPVITDEIDPDNAKLRLELNGKVMQSSCTSLFIWKTAQLVSFISQVMTLLPGDIVTTGTPSGIGPMKNGDEVKVIIEGIGELINHAVSPAGSY